MGVERHIAVERRTAKVERAVRQRGGLRVAALGRKPGNTIANALSAHALNVLDEHNNVVALRAKVSSQRQGRRVDIRTRQGKREMGHRSR